MALNTNSTFLGQESTQLTEIDNADSTTAITIVTAAASPAEGRKVVALTINTDDTKEEYYRLIENDGTTDFYVATITVPIGAGRGSTNSNPAVNVLNRDDVPGLDVNGNYTLEASHSLKLAAVTAITSAKTTHVRAILASLGA